MRKFSIIIIMVLLFSSVVPMAMSLTAEEMLKDPNLTDMERNAIAKAISKSGPESSFPQTLKGVLEWREMGEAFAETIKQICTTLNVEVNAFLHSDVGKLTAAVIVYKMVGKDIIRIILYTCIWLGVTFFIGSSIKFLHMKKRVKNFISKDDKTPVIGISYIDRFSWDDDVTKEISLFVHIIAWFIFSCIIAYNII
jgi:hypothetical protein